MSKKSIAHRIADVVPAFGKTVMYLKGKKVINPKFETSGQYWQERYDLGGDSGAGSYEHLAEFKGEFLNDFVEKNGIESVIEFGSGDGNQLRYLRFPSYLGVDISPKAIDDCRELYAGHDHMEFILLDEFTEQKADLTLSLDVIYHLVEDEVFEEYMRRLFASSKRYVIVYSSNMPDYEFDENMPHVKHRRFTDWVDRNEPGFSLVDHVPNKYPFDGDGSRTSYSDFFVFERISRDDIPS